MKIPATTIVCDGQRRKLLKGVAAAVSTALVGAACSRSDENVADSLTPPVSPKDSVPPGVIALSSGSLDVANRLLSKIVSVDVHCHPGLFFFNGMGMMEDPDLAVLAEQAGFESRTVADMKAGGLTAGLFATVADIKLLGVGEKGLYARREFEPGEAYADHQRQLNVLHGMLKNDLVMAVHCDDDLAKLKKAGKIGAILATEGADFLEQKGERIEAAHAAGIRSIGLVHYHVNDIGDIQTAAPVHGGLTDFGREAVKEMNRLGIVIDLAHARFETARDAAELSSQPVLISHSFIADKDIQHPRLLSVDHAKLIAETGGLVGAWPSGVGNSNFTKFIDRVLRLVDLIGVDHVGLGTDMDANYRPVFTNYRQLPHFPASLQERGMNDEEIGKVLGGNFMRIFTEVTDNAA